MAVAYESVATASSATIAKPTGLAVDDFMVAHLAGSNAGTVTIDNFSKTGWTLAAGAQSSSGLATHRATALYKRADSSDVAASDFTFTADADATIIAGAIYRFSGAGAVEGAADDDATSTDTHTFTNTLTPSYANSMMLLLMSCNNSGGSSFSGYAIANDNPTWTERVDFANTAGGSDNDPTLAGATASRPEVTATGNSTGLTTANVNDAVGIIVAVYPPSNGSVSVDVISATLSVPAVTVTGGASASADTLTMTLSVPSQTGAAATPDWANPDKSSTSSWINPDKT